MNATENEIKKRIKTTNIVAELYSQLIIIIGSTIFATQSALALDLAGPTCPLAGDGGPRSRAVSELFPGATACDNASRVQQLIFNIGPSGVLIVDKQCIFNAGLRLPSRFTLKGLGLGSESQMQFTHDGIALSVCQNGSRDYVTIADMDLYGPYSSNKSQNAIHSIGMALAHSSNIYLSHVRISGFQKGVTGLNTFSVFIDTSNISDNRHTNIEIGYGSNGWRIRDGIVSQAGIWGVNIQGPDDATPLTVKENGREVMINSSNDLLIDGVRMESNRRAALRINNYGTRIINSRFEGNGKANFTPNSNKAIVVEKHAQEARILTNYFDNNCIQISNFAQATKRAYNMPVTTNTNSCRVAQVSSP